MPSKKGVWVHHAPAGCVLVHQFGRAGHGHGVRVHRAHRACAGAAEVTQHQVQQKSHISLLIALPGVLQRRQWRALKQRPLARAASWRRERRPRRLRSGRRRRQRQPWRVQRCELCARCVRVFVPGGLRSRMWGHALASSSRAIFTV